MKDDDIKKELNNPELKGREWALKARELGLKPGQVIGSTGMWVPWIKDDLDPKDTVTFLAQDVIGSQGGNYFDEYGQRFIVLDVNGLTCRINIGKINTINSFFYSRYEQMVNGNIELENFKRHGPARAMPWEKWFYEAQAVSFGFDIDGRPLRHPEWYQIDEYGIPIKIKNIKKIMDIYFHGDIDFNITKAELVELIFEVYKKKLIGKIKKIFGRSNDNKKSQRRSANGHGNKAK